MQSLSHLYIKWLANYTFNRSLLRQNKQLSKLANAYAWWWLLFIQILPASATVVQRPKYLLMSSVVGWKRSRHRVAWYNSHCPGITLKFSVFDNTFLPGQWRFRVQAQIIRFDSIRAFNVQRSLSVGLRPHRGFQYFNSNSQARNISFLTSKSTFVSLSMAHYLSSFQNITCNC